VVALIGPIGRGTANRDYAQKSLRLTRFFGDTFMDYRHIVQEKIDAELSRIVDAALLGAMKPLLVAPRCEMRGWDYGEFGQEFPCWIVLDHLQTNTCIAYCECGFGPSFPWGLLFITGQFLSMGMDSGWYANLEDAFRESMAWDGDNPPGYEVA